MGGVYEVVGVCRHVPGCSCNGGFPGIRDLGVHDDDGDDDDGDWAGRVRILGKEDRNKRGNGFYLFLKDVKSVDAVTEFVKKKLKKRKKKKRKKKKSNSIRSREFGFIIIQKVHWRPFCFDFWHF